MDFETLAVAKSYTNQQILNNDQGNSDEPFVLNMLDYGVDLVKIMKENGLKGGIVPLINIESLKEEILNKDKPIILNFRSELDADFILLANAGKYEVDGSFQINSIFTYILGTSPSEIYSITCIINPELGCFMIVEDMFNRISNLLPPYSDASMDDGKFLRIVGEKPAWVSLDDVSEVGA